MEANDIRYNLLSCPICQHIICLHVCERNDKRGKKNTLQAVYALSGTPIALSVCARRCVLSSDINLERKWKRKCLVAGPLPEGQHLGLGALCLSTFKYSDLEKLVWNNVVSGLALECISHCDAAECLKRTCSLTQ